MIKQKTYTLEQNTGKHTQTTKLRKNIRKKQNKKNKSPGTKHRQNTHKTKLRKHS